MQDIVLCGFDLISLLLFSAELVSLALVTRSMNKVTSAIFGSTRVFYNEIIDGISC